MKKRKRKTNILLILICAATFGSVISSAIIVGKTATPTHAAGTQQVVSSWFENINSAMVYE